MAKSLTLSNGELQINIDQHGQVNGLFFPYIGLENHTPGTKHRVGAWVDGEISWLDDGTWTHRARFPHPGLIGHTVMVNERLGVLLEFEDFVQSETNAFIRNIHVVNIKSHQRQIRLFLHQAFSISSNSYDDTAQYLSTRTAVLHYGGQRAFVASGATDVGHKLDQHSIGLFGGGREGTWRDADDGQLNSSDVERGQTDSTMRFSLTIGGLSSRRVHYWLAVGTSIEQALSVSDNIHSQGVYKGFDETLLWWRKWQHTGLRAAERLPSRYRQGFSDSLVQLKSVTDRRGAILSRRRSEQPICSPHTAAYAIWPLVRLGYKDEAQRFFSFCREALTKTGYLHSSYLADGSVGPTKLPYVNGLAPIQSSQTALVLFVFAQTYALIRRPKILEDFYSSFVEPMANFLSDFTDEEGFPLPSYDLANQELEVSSYTTSLTHGALVAAAELADKMKNRDDAVRWRSTAEDMRRAALERINQGDYIHQSLTDDRPSISGLYGAFMFGVIDIDDPMIGATAERVEVALRGKDQLFSSANDPEQVDYVGSLWMSQYYKEVGRDKEAGAILTQVLERVRSYDEATLGETTWIHAEILNTLLDNLTQP